MTVWGKCDDYSAVKGHSHTVTPALPLCQTSHRPLSSPPGPCLRLALQLTMSPTSLRLEEQTTVLAATTTEPLLLTLGRRGISHKPPAPGGLIFPSVRRVAGRFLEGRSLSPQPLHQEMIESGVCSTGLPAPLQWLHLLPMAAQQFYFGVGPPSLPEWMFLSS